MSTPAARSVSTSAGSICSRALPWVRFMMGSVRLHADPLREQRSGRNEAAPPAVDEDGVALAQRRIACGHGDQEARDEYRGGVEASRLFRQRGELTRVARAAAHRVRGE